MRQHGHTSRRLAEQGAKRITALVSARRNGAEEILKSKNAADELQLRLRELIKLAKEQGYLTFDDLNEALPDGITDANELDAILTRLRRMETRRNRQRPALRVLLRGCATRACSLEAWPVLSLFWPSFWPFC